MPLNTTSVVLDNNRAQRNIVFAPLAPGASASWAYFWVYNVPEATDRGMEITLQSDALTASAVYLIIPPTVGVNGLTNARAVARLRDPRAAARCAAGEQRTCFDECPIELVGDARCTLVLAVTEPSRPVRLEGLEVAARTRLRLGVAVESSAAPGAAVDAVVLETAKSVYDADEARHVVGALTVRFQTPRRQ
jgi:hypothetical protein